MRKRFVSLTLAVVAVSCISAIQPGVLAPGIIVSPGQSRCHVPRQNRGHMHHNNDPPQNPHGASRRRFRLLEPDPEISELESKLKERQLASDPDVVRLLRNARFYSDESRQWAIGQLRAVLSKESADSTASGSAFRPLAPVQWLSQGDLHLYDQVDNTPWYIPLNALTRGMLLAGPQGGGKTRFLISLCLQLNAFR